jgi:AcrR family transcriptional regulator
MAGSYTTFVVDTQSPDKPRPRSRTRRPDERRRQIADAALEVLAAEGARGLTHRAVDRAAGLPEGSTSNVYRSRAALLEGTVAHHASMDLAAGTEPSGVPAPLPALSRKDAASLVKAGFFAVLERREHNVARFELLLESTRREELSEPIALARSEFAARTKSLLEASGCDEPDRHARQLLATLDGLLLADLYGGENRLEVQDVEAAVDRFFATC